MPYQYWYGTTMQQFSLRASKSFFVSPNHLFWSVESEMFRNTA